MLRVRGAGYCWLYLSRYLTSQNRGCSSARTNLQNMLQSRATPPLLAVGGCYVCLLCCVQSWHMMTFSLEFSWITWIPLPSLPPGPVSPARASGAEVMKHFVSQQSAQPAQLTANCQHRIPASASFPWHWLGLVVDIYLEVKAKTDCSVDISTI